MFLLENKRITSNKGHLTFKNTLTILFAVFNDQKLLKLKINLVFFFEISVGNSDSSHAIILSTVSFPIDPFLLFLVHLRCYWAPLWVIITTERLSKNFDIKKVFIRTIFLKLLQF